MKFILGKKLGMTQVFREDGRVVPVTRVQAGPCTITQVKAIEDGQKAVQVGFGQQKQFRLNKAQKGHLKDLETVRHLKDFRIDEECKVKRGDKYNVTVFSPGDKVKVVGTSKGKGFQGVVKRHGFAGSPASHGHKDQLRMPGSIGATDAARVFKGTRMAGHMGNERVTVKNLEIIGVKEEDNELLIKGALPGARGGLLMIISSEGNMDLTEVEAPETQTKEEEAEQAPAKEEVGVTKEETKEVEEKKEETLEQVPKEEESEDKQEVKEETVSSEEKTADKAEELPKEEKNN